MPGGFLLDSDAQDARVNAFDSWLDEQKQKAADAASAAASSAGSAADAAVQTVTAPVQAAVTAVQAAPSEAAQRFDDWFAQQQAAHQQQLAATLSAPPQAPAAPIATSTPTPAAPTDPSQQSPTDRFDSWLDQQRQNLANSALGQTVGNVSQAVGDTAQNVTTTATDLASAGAQKVDQAVKATGTAMNQSQFNDPQLTADEAYAACGPAAAVRFAEMFGRNPTLREATDLASQVGWTSANGMAGIQSEKALMDKLGVQTHVVGADWDAIAKEAQTGNPVTISTPGHYFMADGYDPNSGAFHVGRSGLDLKQGSEWMTPQQMESLMGKAQGALFADNPTVPSQGGQSTQGGTPSGSIPTAATSPGTGQGNAPPSTAIDASSPQNFARSVAPYAQYAAQKLGLDPTWVAAMMASESNYGKADAAGHELFGVKALPGQPHTTLMTHEGENGGTQMNQDFAAYDSPLDSVNAWIDLIQKHYPGAVNAQDLPTFVHGLKQGGYFTAGEGEYLGNVGSIASNIGGSVQQGLQDAGSAVGGAVGGAASALGTTASNALNTVTGASGRVAQGAQDVLNQGKTQLQQLQDQAAQLQADFTARQQQLQKAIDDAAKQGEQYRTGLQHQVDQTQQDIFKPRDFSSTLNAAQQGAQDILNSGPAQAVSRAAGSAFDVAPSPAGGTLGQNVRDIQNAPDNLRNLGQGLQAAGGEAQREQNEPGLLATAARTGLNLAGRDLSPEAEQALNAATPPMLSSAHAGGAVSAFLKSANIVPASQTVNLPFIGVTPVADIVGLATDMVMPMGAEERFASSGSQRALDRAAFEVAQRSGTAGRGILDRPGTQAAWAAALGSKTGEGADAARLAMSGVGRWARSSVQQIADDLAQGPVGKLVTDETGTLDTDKLTQIAQTVKTEMTRMYHGTGSGFASADPAYMAGEENLYGPGHYLTSDPRVAGGVVSEGGEQVGPSWLVSNVKREGGQVISPGYAQERALDGAGANVRPVNVPQALKLLDVDAPLKPEDRDAILAALRSSGDPRDLPVADQFEQWTANPATTAQNAYDALANVNKTFANKTLADAGFDGITYAGGSRIPMTDATGQAIQHQATAVFPQSVSKVRNALSDEAGSVGLGAGMRLGGGAAGLLGSENTMSPEDKQDPWGRFSRDVGATLLGAAAPGVIGAVARGGGVSYRDLAAVRPAVGPPLARGPQTLAQNISAYTKGNLLSGLKTHVTNIASQLVELAHQPLSSLASGREDDAVAGIKASAQAVPDALRNFAKTLSTGETQFTQSQGATSAWLPALRLLGATDDFFRTIGWAMGAGQEGQRVLREAGATPGTASSILGSNATRISEAGDKAGAMSVFGEGTGPGHAISSLKNRLLGSSNYGDQLKGMLLDAGVPFAAVPGRIWHTGIARTPGIGELNALRKAGIAIKAGDQAGFQKAMGDAAVQSVISASILSNVFKGNIRGPDDKEHPSGIKINGRWFDYSGWGPWVLPMSIPAALVEAQQKEGNKPNPDMPKAWANALGKTLSNQFYAADIIKTLNQVGEGNTTGAAGSLAQGYVDRYLPAGALMNTATQLWDPVLRDPSNEGLRAFVEREQAKVPGLESKLPAKPNMLTGEPEQRTSSGPGQLIGMQTRSAGPVAAAVADLERKNYTISDPTKVPTDITLRGSSVHLTEDEGRKLAAQRGQLIDEALGSLVGSAEWNKMSDDDRAMTLNRVMARIDSRNAALWADMTSDAEVERRLGQGKRVAGRIEPTVQPVLAGSR